MRTRAICYADILKYYGGVGIRCLSYNWECSNGRAQTREEHRRSAIGDRTLYKNVAFPVWNSRKSQIQPSVCIVEAGSYSPNKKSRNVDWGGASYLEGHTRRQTRCAWRSHLLLPRRRCWWHWRATQRIHPHQQERYCPDKRYPNMFPHNPRSPAAIEL